MKERIINTDKLDEKYGIKEYHSVEKVDVFIDAENSGSYLVIEYYSDYEKGKRIPKQNIYRFNDRNVLEEYIKNTVTNYELTHDVLDEQRKLHFHYVVFQNIMYYLHDGKPDKNYLEFNYTEYKNGKYFNEKITLPKEYEKILVKSLEESKKYQGRITNDPKYYKLIDVYQERRDRKERIVNQHVEAMAFSVNEFCDIIKIGWNKHRKEIITALKVFASSALVYVLLSGGYSLAKNIFKGNVKAVDLKLPSYNKTDLYIRNSTNKATNVIRDIMYKDKDEISKEDLNFIVDYFNNLEMVNYDNNSSFAVFNYDSYFIPALAEINNDDDAYKKIVCQNLLMKIKKMYDACFSSKDKKVIINKDACFEFFNFVSSLTFAHDVEYRDLPVGVNKFSKKTERLGFASVSEINAYRSLPQVLKLAILSQLRGIESNMKFTFKETPVYYFEKNNYDSINNSINAEINTTINSMFYEFGYLYSKKTK